MVERGSWLVASLLKEFKEEAYPLEDIIKELSKVDDQEEDRTEELDLRMRVNTLYYENIYQRIKTQNWFKDHPYHNFLEHVIFLFILGLSEQ